VLYCYVHRGMPGGGWGALDRWQSPSAGEDHVAAYEDEAAAQEAEACCYYNHGAAGGAAAAPSGAPSSSSSSSSSLSEGASGASKAARLAEAAATVGLAAPGWPSGLLAESGAALGIKSQAGTLRGTRLSIGKPAKPPAAAFSGAAWTAALAGNMVAGRGGVAKIRRESDAVLSAARKAVAQAASEHRPWLAEDEPAARRQKKARAPASLERAAAGRTPAAGVVTTPLGGSAALDRAEQHVVRCAWLARSVKKLPARAGPAEKVQFMLSERLKALAAAQSRITL